VKRLIVITCMVFLPMATMAQVQHFHFTQNGEFASVAEPTGPGSNFSLTVSRNSDNGGTTATLNYFASSIAPDFNSVTFTQIVGAIPAGDFTGQNTQNLNLNFNTSDLDPNTSFSQTCTFSFIDFSITCGPAAAGSIQLSFRENGTQRTRVLALAEEITTGATTLHIHQRSDNSTANVMGSVFGTSVMGGNAQVGVNHSSTLEFVRTR
jgi:hypothetical protein